MSEGPINTETNLAGTLLNALAPLEQANPAAFKALQVQIEQGKFEERLTKRPLQTLADELLDTVNAAVEAWDEG